MMKFRIGWVAVVAALSTLSIEASPFLKNGDGTVTDLGTNLRWQECSAGLSGSDCGVGVAGTFTWQGALSYCNTLGLSGLTWRLPSVSELKTLIDGNKATGAMIDLSAFPATSASAIYWTATTYAYSINYAWFIRFITSTTGITNMDGTPKSSARNVRCVTNGP